MSTGANVDIVESNKVMTRLRREVIENVSLFKVAQKATRKGKE